MQPSSKPKKPSLEDLIAQFVQTSQQNQNTMQASITKLETQIGQLATIVHERAQGTFPSQPEINPQNVEHAKSIRTLRSGKSYDRREEATTIVGKEDEGTKETKGLLPAPTQGKPGDFDRTSNDDQIAPVKERIYVPPLPFPAAQRVHKEKNDQMDILEMFKKVHINIPLLDAVKQFPSYAKFLKDACTNKRKFATHEKVLLTEECSAVLLKKFASKIEGPREFYNSLYCW